MSSVVVRPWTLHRVDPLHRRIDYQVEEEFSHGTDVTFFPNFFSLHICSLCWSPRNVSTSSSPVLTRWSHRISKMKKKNGAPFSRPHPQPKWTHPSWNPKKRKRNPVFFLCSHEISRPVLSYRCEDENKAREFGGCIRPVRYVLTPSFRKSRSSSPKNEPFNREMQLQIRRLVTLTCFMISNSNSLSRSEIWVWSRKKNCEEYFPEWVWCQEATDVIFFNKSEECEALRHALEFDNKKPLGEKRYLQKHLLVEWFVFVVWWPGFSERVWRPLK